MADDLRNIILRFTGEGDDAKGEMESIIALLVEIGAIDADATVDVKGIPVAVGKLDILHRALKDIDNEHVEIKVDIDQQRLSIFSRVMNLFRAGSKEGEDALGGFSGAVKNLNINLPGFLGRLNAVSGAAFVLAIAIGVQVVGALGALVASLAGAAAGLAALAAAFGAALGPALLLVIGVVQRLTAVWKVLKQEDQAQLQSEQQRIQGNKAMVAALEQRHQAYINLRRASAEVGAAETAAFREMQDAIERATDAVLAFHRAQLDEQSAKLGIKEAEFELKKFIHDMKLGQKEASALFNKFTDVAFDPSKLNKALGKVKLPGDTGLDQEGNALRLQRLILNVKEARQHEKEATDGVSDSIREKSRAEQDAQKFTEQGIKASGRYVAALRAEADARRAVKTAQRGVVDAKTLSDQAKVQAMTGQLTRQERLLLGVLKEVRQSFKDTFGPGVETIVTGIAVALGIIGKRVRGLKRSFTTLGQGLAVGIVALTDHFTSPEMIKTFQQFATSATILIAPLVSIFQSLGDILLSVAKVAMPFLITAVQNLAGWFADLATKVNSPTGLIGLTGIIATLVDHFNTWFGIVKTVGAILIEFFTQVSPFALQFANDIKGAAENFLAWMQSKEGRDEIRRFMETAIPLAEALGGFIAALAGFFIRLGEIVGPVLTPILTLFSSLLRVQTRISAVLADIFKALGAVLSFIVNNFTVKIINAFGDVVTTIINWAVDLGKNIIHGIIKGLKDKVSLKGLKDALLGGVKDSFNAAKSFFGIHSPSKLTAEMGRDLTHGIIKGIKDASKDLEKAAVVNLAHPVLNPLQATAKAGRVAGAAASGGGGDSIFQLGDLILPAPAGGGLADPRAQAVQLLNELKRSGRKARGR